MPKRTILVEEEQEFQYCSKCERSDLTESDFYKFSNESEIYKTGFRPFCKSCLQDMYDYYYELYCNHENREVRMSMALDRLCQVIDTPFSFRVVEPAISMIKKEAKEKNLPIDSPLVTSVVSRYMQMLNGAHRKGLAKENYDVVTKDRVDLYIEYFKIKSYIIEAEQTEIGESNFEEDVPKFLLQIDYLENVKQKAGDLYRYLSRIVTDHNEINNTYIEMACLEYANWLQSIYHPDSEASATAISNARDKSQKAFEGALQQLGVDPKSVKLEESEKTVLGMKIQTLERTSPPDYYGQPDKIERIKNIHNRYTDDEYNYKFTLRSIKNYFAGQADYAGLDYDDFNAHNEESQELVDSLISSGKTLADANIEEETKDVNTSRSSKK